MVSVKLPLTIGYTLQKYYNYKTIHANKGNSHFISSIKNLAKKSIISKELAKK